MPVKKQILQLPTQVEVRGDFASIDHAYGPFPSKEYAFNYLFNRGMLAVGRTFAVKTADGIKEYQFKRACSSVSDAEEKAAPAGSDTGGAGMQIFTSQEECSTEKIRIERVYRGGDKSVDGTKIMYIGDSEVEIYVFEGEDEWQTLYRGINTKDADGDTGDSVDIEEYNFLATGEDPKFIPGSAIISKINTLINDANISAGNSNLFFITTSNSIDASNTSNIYIAKQGDYSGESLFDTEGLVITGTYGVIRHNGSAWVSEEISGEGRRVEPITAWPATPDTDLIYLVDNRNGSAVVTIGTATIPVGATAYAYYDGNDWVVSVQGGSVEIVNDLTTGGVNKALSAEMGKTIGKNIDGYIETVVYDQYSSDILANPGKALNTSGKSINNSASTGVTDFISTEGVVEIVLDGNYAWDQRLQIAFYEDDDETTFISGVTLVDAETNVTIPAGAAYFRACVHATVAVWEPGASTTVTFRKGIKYAIDDLKVGIDNVPKVVRGLRRLNDKTLVTVMDSFGLYGVQEVIANKLGVKWDKNLNKIFSKGSRSTLNENAGGQERLIKLKNKVLNNECPVPDILIYENVNDYTATPGTSGDNPYFMSETGVSDVSVSGFSSSSAADSYFRDNANFTSIVNSVTAGNRCHGYRLRMPVVNNKATILTISGSPVADGTLYIETGLEGGRFAFPLTAGMTPQEIVTLIDQTDYKKIEKEVSEDGLSITFTPTASINNIDIDVDTTDVSGVTAALLIDQQGTYHITETFVSRNVNDDWGDSTKWKTFDDITLWSRYKGILSFVGEHFPTSKFYFFIPSTYNVQLSTPQHPLPDDISQMFGALADMQSNFCEAYCVPCLDIRKNAGITPCNCRTFFTSGYHPNKDGVIRWGEAIAELLNWSIG